MQRLLIVDDEPEICELIRTLIDWDQLGLELLGMAQNGELADKIIAEQVPDIVITDIQMPGYSGLQLIERAQAYPTKFIVVSGYREFEYAQKAMRFGVEDYLLKPINKAELNRILRRIQEYHKQALQKNDEELQLRDTVEEHTKGLRKSAMQKAICSAEASVAAELFALGEGTHQFAAVHIDWVQIENTMKAHEMVLQNISEQIAQEIEGLRDCESVMLDMTAYVWLHFPEEKTDLGQALNVLMRILKEKNIQYAPARVTVGLGAQVSDVRDWKFAAESAKQCIGARLVFGNAHVIRYAQVQALPEQPTIQFTNADKKYLAADIGLLDIPKCIASVQSWLGAFETQRCQAVCNLHQQAFEAAEFVLQTMRYLGLCGDETAQISPALMPMSLKHIVRKLDNCFTVQQLCRCLCMFISDELTKCIEIKKHRESEPIRIAKQYVAEHIEKQISLEEVASQIYMSAKYFSTLFHDKTGVTFSDYVIGVRMDLAKTLLRENKLPVSEVARRVGYTDAKHFSKLFQKLVGIKPTAYKKFYE